MVCTWLWIKRSQKWFFSHKFLLKLKVTNGISCIQSNCHNAERIKYKTFEIISRCLNWNKDHQYDEKNSVSPREKLFVTNDTLHAIETNQICLCRSFQLNRFKNVLYLKQLPWNQFTIEQSLQFTILKPNIQNNL